ncbi:MAG: hypothetical protein A4E28_01999 [Methanocella sp. PtaU1.Bin125]|nr:MAG: hypothetical protein A4E28_01999 [Methanocella sp. PtaU1.Bin125]
MTVQGAVDDAVKKGTYPDRKAAIAGLTKQLIDYQKGVLKGKLGGDSVSTIEKMREELWPSLMKQAGGDEDRAARLYAEEMKKISIQEP